MSDGFVRRAQVAVSCFCLLCLALFLTAYSAKHPAVARAGSAAISELVAPVHSLTAFVSTVVGSCWQRYVALVGIAEENEVLRQRLRQIEGEVAGLAEVRTENDRLRGVLHFVEQGGLEGVLARVVAYDPSGWVEGVLVNRGSSHGIEVGMAAVVERGVVGQVVAASPNSARILLITDHASGVDALVQGSRARGVVEGGGGQLCALRFVMRDQPVKLGERVLTSGLDGVFPKGLVIGTVADTETGSGSLFQSVVVKPTVDLTRLEEVFIVTAPRPVALEAPGVAVAAVKRLQGRD